MAASKTQKRMAVASLANGGTHQEAADAAGVSIRTVRRWLKQPGFKKALSFLTDCAIRSAYLTLVTGMTKAIAKITALMESADTDAIKLSAAKALLDNVTKLGEQVDVRERLEKLAKMLGDQGPDAGEGCLTSQSTPA